ncbi:alkaline phosphatase [Desulfosarcina cetonica]|uniref:alkaline phosphatase n=1 Tax=Desulfosarcina cetonica TaxID=90730 RepID=UPI0006D04F70|nr:alkaline phosphatase [Desulfosarcina cetonica]
MFEQAGIGEGKTPEMFWVDSSESYPEGEPTLSEMTAAALDLLEKDKDGLFLMVEGSQVDWANHAKDVKYQIAESLAFDNAVKVVLDWVDADFRRKKIRLSSLSPTMIVAVLALMAPTEPFQKPERSSRMVGQAPTTQPLTRSFIVRDRAVKISTQQ